VRRVAASPASLRQPTAAGERQGNEQRTSHGAGKNPLLKGVLLILLHNVASL
jgi:hypothetical protein